MAAMATELMCVSAWITMTPGWVAMMAMVAGARATGWGHRGRSCLDPISTEVEHHTKGTTGRRQMPIRFRRFRRDRILVVGDHLSDQGLGDSLL